MERLTNKCWANFDPWECCGQDHFCTRGCHDLGGCTGGCIVPKLYARLGIYEDTDLTPERAQELAQADKDGRLAVLPCKLGDIVYDISDGTPYATRVLSFSYFGDHWACRTVSSYPNLEEFGARIFLTLEEAEVAIEKREADNEAD